MWMAFRVPLDLFHQNYHEYTKYTQRMKDKYNSVEAPLHIYPMMGRGRTPLENYKHLRSLFIEGNTYRPLPKRGGSRQMPKVLKAPTQGPLLSRLANSLNTACECKKKGTKLVDLCHRLTFQIHPHFSTPKMGWCGCVGQTWSTEMELYVCEF